MFRISDEDDVVVVGPSRRCRRQWCWSAGWIIPVYGRSELIDVAIETLKVTLIDETVMVALVTVALLLHVRSALVAIIMLPVGIQMAVAAMKLLGLGSKASGEDRGRLGSSAWLSKVFLEACLAESAASGELFHPDLDFVFSGMCGIERTAVPVFEFAMLLVLGI